MTEKIYPVVPRMPRKVGGSGAESTVVMKVERLSGESSKEAIVR